MYMKQSRTDAIKRMLSIKETANYMNLGINSTRSLITEIGATVKVGKRVLVDRYKLDEFIDNNAQRLAEERANA